jgi:hypothetical protein
MARVALQIGAVLGALALLGCESEASPSGLDEPLRVAQAAFKEGELPSGDADVSVTAVTALNRVVEASQAGKALSGRVSDDAYAIAMRLEDLGSGYWVKPAGVADANYPGELIWQAVLDFGADIAPGAHVLELVAIDREGRGGARTQLELCVRAPYDDSLNACDRAKPPPAAVISLSWDSDADLDLVVVTPSGRTVDARHPTTDSDADADSDSDSDSDSDADSDSDSDSGTGSGSAAAADSTGVLSADSNPDCARDSIRREDLVWGGAPEPGTYRVFANLWNACGKPTTHFKLATYARQPRKDGTYRLEELDAPVYGEISGTTANGGAATGLFVTTVKFEKERL